jgi:ArsR family transcriptional regulator, lead/cadmium/zinc/bismuth-responsive transcriptional repressor
MQPLVKKECSYSASKEQVEEKLAETQLILAEMMETVTKSLQKINENINEIIHSLKTDLAKANSGSFEPSVMLEFPDHMRITVRALLELGRATAEEVSKKTRRSRPLESSYLNQLMRMGYVEKEKKGQFTYYKINFSKRKTKGETV